MSKPNPGRPIISFTQPLDRGSKDIHHRARHPRTGSRTWLCWPSQFIRIDLVVLCTIIAMAAVGCGRSSDSGSVTSSTGGAAPQSSAPTPTSSAIVAATPTEPPTTGAVDAENSSQNAEGSADAEQPASDSDVQAAEAENSEAGRPICEQDIALDLVGHPLYSEPFESSELFDMLGCPASGSTSWDIAINEFGEGPEYNRFMLWFSPESQIYVLRPEQTWQAFDDTWSEDQPIIQCNPLGIEEASPPLPRRGFGKLWCSDSELQSVMGTVDREERLCQHTAIQQFENGRLLGCFEDATIRYFQIFDDGSWSMRFVQ